MENVSLIVPIHSEDIDLAFFIAWVTRALSEKTFIRRSRSVTFEIILITDCADNPAIQQGKSMEHNLPIKVYIEKEKMSTAALCSKGFSYATYPILAKVTPDLHYPPETLISIITNIQANSDVVVAFQTQQTIHNNNEALQTVTDPFLFNLQKDPLAGTLFFTKYVWDTIQFTPSDKTFNLEFLHRAIEAGFMVKSFAINTKTVAAQSVFSRIRKTFSATVALLQMKMKEIHPQYVLPQTYKSMGNAGFGYKRKKYVTHTTLKYTDSALESFTFKHIIVGGTLVEFFIVGLLVNPTFIAQIIVGVLSIIYFIDILFNLFLVLKTIRTTYEVSYTPEEFIALQENTLPVYSILCPLYKESHMILNFLDGIAKIDYPTDKLDVILLLEADDTHAIAAVKEMQIPAYVRTIVVPESLPKTKPKACNYGLIYCKGEYVVIYDAEDIPDPLQLKKAYIGFQKSDRRVVCLQAKLNYYNPQQNLLTRFFTAEYSLWFDVTLTGLQSINTTIPLGGTSNHFRTKDLLRLEGWDPFNVTEDADLGIRLFKLGYKTAIIDSVTLEEANSRWGNWLRQRSRWIKGYMQTYLVHTRNITPFVKERGIHAVIFHLIIGGKIAFIFINPIFWIITLSYFILHGAFGALIETIYPTPVLYIAIISLIFGNYLYLFCYIIGCVKNGQWGLIKYVYIIPFYWLAMSIAGCMAFYQLLFRPHYWEKTIHGLGLQKKSAILTTIMPAVISNI